VTAPHVEAGPPPAWLEAELGADLAAMIAATGVPVVEAAPVTTIRWLGSSRASFRLALADGRVLKGRRFRTPADVLRVTSISSLLDPRHFPPVLASRGCALLTPWIPGRSPSADAWTPALLSVCGGVMATLHRTPILPEVASLQPRRLHWTERVDRWLGELVGARALGVSEAREISDLATLSAPATSRTAVCHTDLCGDNIVATLDGELWVVDNEGLSLDAPEFDLARTWYRWPMTPPQQRAFAEGYGAHEHSPHFEAHFLHWALLAVLDSAAYRTRAGVAGARIPLARLTELRRGRGRDDSFPRFLGRQ
jgi:hypothetical protein